MTDDGNILSDDAKWFIQMAAVYVTLAFVFFRSWEKRDGRAQDAVTMNGLRWKAQRLAVRENGNLTEFEIQDLQNNADKARKALEIIERGYGTYQCPWQEDGRKCPVEGASVSEFKGRDAILEHVKKAYEAEDLKIRQRIEERRTKTPSAPPGQAEVQPAVPIGPVVTPNKTAVTGQLPGNQGNKNESDFALHEDTRLLIF